MHHDTLLLKLSPPKEEEPAWKARRAKQMARAKVKTEGSVAGQGTNGNTADKSEDPTSDPDTEHWGELLEDLKGGISSEKGGRVGEGTAALAAPGAGGSGEESSAQKKAKKKSKKKKGNQWNNKAPNLWVYVKGERGTLIKLRYSEDLVS